MWRTMRARNIQTIPEQAGGVFPVPPLPPDEMASKEKADA